MLYLIVAGGILFLLDQWSKRMVHANAADRCISWRGILRIRRVINLNNTYKSGGVRIALVLIWLAALISALILYRFGGSFQSHAALCGLGAALGGAAGNLLDILMRRGVVDFIDLRVWPVFNLADVAILGGLVIAFWSHT